MNDYKNKSAAGLLPSDDKITLQQWLKTWLHEYRVNDLSPSSLDKYNGIYNNYIKNSEIGVIKLKDLSTSNLQAYYNVLMSKHKKSPNVIKTINKTIKCCLNQAVKETYILFNCSNNVILPKLASKKEVEIFTVEEQQQFIRSLDNHRHRVLFILVFATGLRLGEVTALKWHDINFEKNELSVKRTFKRVTILGKTEGNKTEIIEQPPKTEHSKRTIPIPSNVIIELKKHRKNQLAEKLKNKLIYVDNDLVFPNEIGEPTDPRNLDRSYARALKNAGISHKKFHALRHTYATRLFEADVPLKTVQELLGHSDISITANIYTHVMPKQKIAAVEKINSLFAL